MLFGLLVSCVVDSPPEPEVAPPPAPALIPDPDPGEGVRIAVSFPEHAMQRVKVRTTRTCPAEGTTEWWMANWTPGSYLIRDHARHVETIAASSRPMEASSRSGAPEAERSEAPVTVRQTAKNRWTVACRPGEPVTVETTLVADDRNVRGNFVADTWATLNPPAAFLLPEPPRGPFDIQVELPEPWPDAVVPLPKISADPPTWRAADLDTLIDSPIVVGRLTDRTLTVGGAPHHFVLFGDQDTFDEKLLRTSVAELVATQQAFWGDVPYAEYWFLQALTPTYGGLEHYRSTLLMASPSSTEDRPGTVKWLGLVSHELFHTWNVQRMRPRSLLAQDYEAEAPTELLWVAEGWTSYYDDLLLARAGLVDEEEYLGLLGAQIARLQERPGRLVQSLAASSFNAWTKYYQPTPHQLNSTISYYTKGAVVAFLLDAEIRRATQGRASLDDVARQLRALSESPPTEPLDVRLQSMGERRRIRGFTPDDVRRVASEVAGRDLSGFFDRAVDRPGDLDYGAALQWFGLRLERDDPRPGIGLRTEARGDRIAIGGVLRDGPAWQAGLRVGDELVAIDDRRVTDPDLGGLVGGCSPCTVVRSRDGQLATVTVTPEPASGEPKLVVDEGASPIAARHRRAWLGQ